MAAALACSDTVLCFFTATGYILRRVQIGLKVAIVPAFLAIPRAFFLLLSVKQDRGSKPPNVGSEVSWMNCPYFCVS